MHLLCATFTPDDWRQLLNTTIASGTAPFVLSALAFASAALETSVPPAIRAALAAHPGDERLVRCLGPLSGAARLRLGLSASPTLRDKLALIAYTVFPGAEVLHERFPDATHLPLYALQAKRIFGAFGRGPQHRT